MEKVLHELLTNTASREGANLEHKVLETRSFAPWNDFAE
jgi:hypothetical protein